MEMVAPNESKASQKQAIRDFLIEVKQTITKPSGNYQSWFLAKRKENIDCIAELGLTFKDVRDIVLGLSVVDYCEGPVQDRDVPGDLWVFGKVVSNTEVYIKLKLVTVSVLKVVRIISFHTANKALCYPFNS